MGEYFFPSKNAFAGRSSRACARQTFVVQLCNEDACLPTARAMAGGSYGAIAPSIKAGPAGGQKLVEETLKAMNSLFTEKE